MMYYRYFHILFFVVLAVCADAKVIVVDASGTIRTIHQGIAQAFPGDTVWIRKGLYREPEIIVEKSILIIGEGYPVLDGEGKRSILTIASDGVLVKGLRIIHCGFAGMQDIAGIRIIDAERVSIIGNQLEDNFFGIHISNSANCIVQGNTIHSGSYIEQRSGNGIHLWKCNRMQILDNKISGHRDGIYFEFVTGSLIRNNFSFGNLRYGLHFMFSNGDTYEHNTFQKNGAGVAVMYTEHVTMRHNIFKNNQGESSYGLLLKDIRDSQIEDNTFSENTIGIHMEGTSRSVFRRNTFRENGWAIRLQASCDADTFRFNNFLKNTFDISTNSNLVLNYLSHNYWDKYEGYDLNKDHIGDVPFHPVSLFAMVVEQMPYAMMLWRSFAVALLDKAEKMIPSLTPELLRDDQPLMLTYDHYTATQ